MGKERYIEAVGRRKRAVARVRIRKARASEIVVNGKPFAEYFSHDPGAAEVVAAPLKLVGAGNYAIQARVSGGGWRAQEDAIRLGIARALVQEKPELKATLAKARYLTRDPREKERKKPGLRRARRAPQWQKR